jgi:hypothetical protein
MDSQEYRRNLPSDPVDDAQALRITPKEAIETLLQRESYPTSGEMRELLDKVPSEDSLQCIELQRVLWHSYSTEEDRQRTGAVSYPSRPTWESIKRRLRLALQSEA